MPRFRLTMLDGPELGRTWQYAAETCSIGSHPSNSVRIDDGTVSRFHCEIHVGKTTRVRDLGSLNGLFVDGVRVVEAYLRNGSRIQIGRVILRFDMSGESNSLLVAERTRFGSLVGTSVPMRHCFALLERASQTHSTVLLEGETGTGKSRAAQAIHNLSPRAGKGFVTLDCGAIPATLLESELFGHERGAFTGAVSRKLGAFEEANGGTLFLDEIGELAPELQPKLLRVLEQRTVRRLGGGGEIPVDVRLIAASNRDLRGQVNGGGFRSDLFYRLAVVRITLPSLRQRLEDLPAIVDELLSTLGAKPEMAAPLRTPEFVARLRSAAWPGNIRELRNYIERCLVFQDAVDFEDGPPEEAAATPNDAALPYSEAKRRVVDDFERRYLQALMAKHENKVAAAAAAAEMDRVYLYRLLRRHGIK